MYPYSIMPRQNKIEKVCYKFWKISLSYYVHQKKLGKSELNSEKYPYDIPEGIMFVIGIHEHRDQDYPKQSTVERWNTSTIDSLTVIGGLISNTKSLNHTDKPSGGFRSNQRNW